MDMLSEREREVLKLVALGHLNTEISARLTISGQTVKTCWCRRAFDPGADFALTQDGNSQSQCRQRFA
jgi:DNA-binding NarL/FixJ family response regulator